MEYAGVQMLMEKLKQLINCTHIPVINNRNVKLQRPQFQLLYHELDSLSRILFIDQQHQDHFEKVDDLKQRFMNAAEEAEYIVDVFLSDIIIHARNNGHFPISQDCGPSLYLGDVRRSCNFVFDLFLSCFQLTDNPSLNLDDVRHSFKSIKAEFMNMGSSQSELIQSAPDPISISRSSQGSKKLLDEIVVGLDEDVEQIRDKLVTDYPKKVDVVSIVGMGGIGKTTLATKVFNDGFVKYRFHVRVWVTASQTYDKRAVLIQILESIRGHLDLEKASDSRLREMVHKHLMGKRYLIVIDDIWDIETWDNVKLLFPHGNNGSRILLTSRLTEVAKHANSVGLIHHLGYLNKERSWELLCQKVFHGNECPKWSIKPGMQIVENCQGLPLVIVVIAGVLAKEAWSEKFWMEIAYKTGSYIVDEENRCMETLGLSYNNLPLHLRECFLYLGGFPEDYTFQVQRLIWLWVAEGFIKEDGNRRLEDIGEGYLMDLIDRNLVIVGKRRKSNGGVKACKVHDLLRELCLVKAKEERFFLQTNELELSSHFSDVTTPPYKSVRVFTRVNIAPYGSARNFRSLLSFNYCISLSVEFLSSFVLLRVLDLQSCELTSLPKGIDLLVHLRYLAIWNSSADFPSSICKLWNLQTLIYLVYDNHIVLPGNISDLVNLRHLWSYCPFFLPSIKKPMKLQTITGVKLGERVGDFRKCFPYIKELTCTAYLGKKYDFKLLTSLEKLNLTAGPNFKRNSITLPATLKSLTLVRCGLPWSDMSIIQSLPNLQTLKLSYKAFQGSLWNTDEQEFPQLKFLRLDDLNIERWEAYSRSFPCLKQLEIFYCLDLEEIPFEIGDIPTLELIKVYNCCHSVEESARRIQEEQQDMENYDLKIDIIPFEGIGCQLD